MCCWTLCFCFYSEKLRIRQTKRRNEPQTHYGQKKRKAEPFFNEPGKNALIITGGWLVSPGLCRLGFVDLMLVPLQSSSPHLCSCHLFFSQNEILYEKKKKRRRLRLRRLGKRPQPSIPQDGQPMNDWEKEMRQVSINLKKKTHSFDNNIWVW